MKKNPEPHFFKIIMFTRTGTTFIIKNYFEIIYLILELYYQCIFIKKYNFLSLVFRVKKITRDTENLI